MIKLTRKQLLKSPDEFLTFTEKVGKWVAKYRRRLLVGTAGLLVVGAVVLGLVAYQKRHQHASALAYGQAFYLYQMVHTAPSPDQLSMLIQNFSMVANDYANTYTGRQARLLAGALLMATGDYAKAEDALRQISNDAGLAPEFSALIWGALGQCLEVAGKTTEATQAYVKAAELSGSASASIWRSSQARLLLADDAQQAQDIYRLVLNNSQSPFLRFNAANQLINMGQDIGRLN